MKKLFLLILFLSGCVHLAQQKNLSHPANYGTGSTDKAIEPIPAPNPEDYPFYVQFTDGEEFRKWYGETFHLRTISTGFAHWTIEVLAGEEDQIEFTAGNKRLRCFLFTREQPFHDFIAAGAPFPDISSGMTAMKPHNIEVHANVVCALLKPLKKENSSEEEWTLGEYTAEGNTRALEQELARGVSPDSYGTFQDKWGYKHRWPLIFIALYQIRQADQTSSPVLDLLLDHGADPDILDNEIFGATPLNNLCQRGMLPLVRTLVNRGADVNLSAPNGLSPLHYAAGNCHLQIVQYLTEQGARLDARDKRGRTPLLDSCLPVITYLISKGADFRAEDKEGSTLLSRAITVGDRDLLRLLLSRGIKLTPEERKKTEAMGMSY